MSRNGIFFLAVTVLIAAIAGALVAILQSLVVLVLLVSVLRWLAAKCLKDENLPKSMKAIKKGSYQMRRYNPPSSFRTLENNIILQVTDIRSVDDVNLAFLKLVKACDKDEEELPRFYQDGIMKKLLWEYHRKYGTLDRKVFLDDRKITLEEAVRPISDPTELDEFIIFCMSH